MRIRSEMKKMRFTVDSETFATHFAKENCSYILTHDNMNQLMKTVDANFDLDYHFSNHYGHNITDIENNSNYNFIIISFV